MYSHIKKLMLLLVALGFFMLAFSKAQAQSPQVLLVVGNANTVSADDQALMNRLGTNLGYQVSLLDDNQVASTSGFSGNDLIVISHTINPGFIGTEFTNLSIPVFCSNFLLFDDLDMANAASRGASKTEINIIDQAHPLADGHNDGNLAIYDSPRYMGYGNPSPNAAKVAIMGNKQTRSTLFGYETGSDMLSIAAPARRVGFFLSNQGSAQALTADGWEIFDASICWALGGSCGGNTQPNIPPIALISGEDSPIGIAPFTLELDGSSSSDSDGSIVSWEWNDGNGNSQLMGETFSATYSTPNLYTVTLTVTDDDGASHTTSLDVEVFAAPPPPPSSGNGEILFVVGNANNLSLDDQALELRMTQDNGKIVTVVDDNDYESANVTDYDAIVVSHTVNASVIDNAFLNTPVPVFMLKWLLLDEMDMAFRNTRAANQTSINIHDANHPLAGGQTGAISVYDAPTYMGYGDTGSGADILTIFGNKVSRATIFTYEANAPMLTINAPEKRASFFISGEGDVRKLTLEGWGFFDRIIDWITPNVPTLPISACYQPPIQWASPSPGINRIINRTFREALTEASQATLARDVQETIVYLDGLGREIQTHAIQITPQLREQVSFTKFDELGRTPKQYLPYAKNNLGSFVNGPTTEQNLSFSNLFPDYANQALFAETDFEASPLNRVLEQGAQGNAWQIQRQNGVSTKQGHTQKTNYLTNYWNSSNGQTNLSLVLKWVYNKSNDEFQALGMYSNNLLFITESIDENDKKILEYTDKLGRTLLKRVQIDDSSVNTDQRSWANTYYLYDDKSNLRHIIQPEGSEKLYTNGLNLYAPEVMDAFVFSYTYDERNRVITKKVPGADWESIVYDKLDRPVLTQDGNQRVTGQWTATKYDHLNRPVITGIFKPQVEYTRQGLQNILDQIPNLTYSFSEKRVTTTFTDINGENVQGYSNQAFPSIAEMEVHAITMYDDYDFQVSSGTNPSYQTEPLIANNQSNQRVKGMPTGVRVKVLDNPGWLWTITFYDQYGREIQTQSDHLFGTDVFTQEINFAGEVLKTVDRHDGPQGSVNFIKRFCYDHAGRLLRTTHQVDQQAEIVLATYSYDEMGRQIEKNLHSTDNGSTFLQSADLHYNIRSWMTGMNQLEENGPTVQAGEHVADLFSYQLSYESDLLNPDGEIFPPVGVNPLYNGNISAMRWQDAFDGEMHLYAYNYDAMNRLTDANYATYNGGQAINPGWNGKLSRYNTSYGYDRNGNIETLLRNGKIGNNSFGVLDDLSYAYKNGASNRLASVSDAGNNANGVAIDQFIDGNVNGDDYSYDANGNIIEDLNKGVQISYNHLNKPVFISFTGTGNSISYIYDAAGTKLRQEVSGSSSKIRDYINGFHYTDQSLEFVSHSEGRVVKEQTGAFHYEYNLSDHLGNIRMTFADLDENKTIDTNTEILQTDHYYPFGMRMSINASQQASVAQRYQYNGKELQDDFGLNWSDYGARMYDASIGRWNGVDQLAEIYSDWSPYNFVLGNPILFIDPDGRSVSNPNSGQGNGQKPRDPSSSNPPGAPKNPQDGDTYTYNGRVYYANGGSWGSIPATNITTNRPSEAQIKIYREANWIETNPYSFEGINKEYQGYQVLPKVEVDLSPKQVLKRLGENLWNEITFKTNNRGTKLSALEREWQDPINGYIYSIGPDGIIKLFNQIEPLGGTVPVGPGGAKGILTVTKSAKAVLINLIKRGKIDQAINFAKTQSKSPQATKILTSMGKNLNKSFDEYLLTGENYSKYAETFARTTWLLLRMIK